MNITFAPTFWKSLKKLRKRNTWWYKVYEFFRRDLWWFFGNIWRFRREIYRHRPWDSMYSLSMFRRSLEQLCHCIETQGYEIDVTRLKKVEKMKRAIEILKWHEEDSFLHLAELQTGTEYVYGKFIISDDDISVDERQNNIKLSKLSMTIERDSFNELLDILKGQDYTKFETDVDWNTQFDGSGLQTWWD